MKNNYIAPSICIEELIEEDVILNISTTEEKANKNGEVMTKENNYIDFSDEIEW